MGKTKYVDVSKDSITEEMERELKAVRDDNAKKGGYTRYFEQDTVNEKGEVVKIH